jgi:hypothetical protein
VGRTLDMSLPVVSAALCCSSTVTGWLHERYIPSVVLRYVEKAVHNCLQTSCFQRAEIQAFFASLYLGRHVFSPGVVHVVFLVHSLILR